MTLSERIQKAKEEAIKKAFDAAEEKVNKISEFEIKQMLKSKKLDVYTIGAMAKKLGVDLNAIPEGISYQPVERIKGAPKQNLLIMLSGDFLPGDVVRDSNNHTIYTYEKLPHGYRRNLDFDAELEFLPASAGFDTEIDVKSMEPNIEHRIVIPDKVLSAPIISCSIANFDRKDADKKYHLTINSDQKLVMVSSILPNQNITNIPDISKLANAKPNIIYDSLCQCVNISSQTMLDFVIDATKTNNLILREVASEILQKYFGINKTLTVFTQLTPEEIEQMQNMIKEREERTPEQEKINAIKFYCIEKTPDLLGIDDVMAKKDALKFGIYSREDAIKLCLSNIDANHITAYATTIYGPGAVQSPSFLINTGEGFAIMYNQRTGELSIAGEEKGGTLDLNKEFKECALTELSMDEAKEMLTKLQIQLDVIANDVFDKDATEVPITSVDEKELVK